LSNFFIAESKQATKNTEERATNYRNSYNQVQAELEKIHKEKEELEASLQVEQRMRRDGDA
jgi:Skp family chaperone for outer membrane proteins